MGKTETEIADFLLAERVIDKSQHAIAVQAAMNRSVPIMEALIQINAVDEGTLLKHLANRYKVRFVTTAKLKKADIGKAILERLPRHVALKYNVFPILYDEKANALSIITADPGNLEAEEAVSRMGRGLRVRAYLARPAAIKAAIAKFYNGDVRAFAELVKESVPPEPRASVTGYETSMLDEPAMGRPASPSVQMAGGGRMIEFDERGTPERPAPKSVPPKEANPAAGTADVLGVARVFVSLLEGDRGDLSGHSLLTASFVERMCARIGLSAEENAAISLAAMLHDLGKGEPYHLTALNVAEWDGHRTTGLKRFDTPIRLFEAVKLPEETTRTLRHMYERFDGQGFPDGLKGAEIPLGARILAMADTYADLTSNQRNPHRKILGTAEAMEVLEKNFGKVFDPNLVALFGAVVAGDDLKRQLLTGAQSILVIESDPESCAILDMQLTSRGFRIRTAKTADAAVAMLQKEAMGLVLSEVDLKPFDGFELKKRLNADAKLKKIPFFYYTARAAAADVQKGFGLGAQDYLVKPLTVEIVAMKIQKFFEGARPAEAKGGVSGSLQEMSLPDLVQIIAHGRKTGALRLTSGSQQGEVHFVNGDMYNALFGDLRGDDAFFALLKLKDGSFSLDPSFAATERVIQRTAEMMLLEGLRRYDEENK
jgi:response regulator RpfG family c-di-GMP phosphodiesterase